MRNILFLLVAMFICAAQVDAQKVLQGFDTDTVQGAETVYFTAGSSIVKTGGVVSFTLDKTDVADSLNALTIQGSVDGTNYASLTDATASLSSTTTDGVTILYEVSPKYLYYRLAATCAATDTVIISDCKFMYKED